MNKIVSLFILLINALSVFSVTVYEVNLDPKNFINIRKQANINAEIVDRIAGRQVIFSPYNSIDNGFVHYYKGFVESKYLNVPTESRNCRVGSGTIFRVGPNKEAIAVGNQNEIVKCFGIDYHNSQWMITNKGYALVSKLLVLNDGPIGPNNVIQRKVAMDVFDFFQIRGWTKNAICAMIGNMEYESNLNPTASIGNGHGLVQWRPSTILTRWALERQLDFNHVSTQLQRIDYEYKYNLQYTKTNNCPLTFTQFSKSNESPEYLAKCFMYNYEKSTTGLSQRQEYAKKWTTYF